MHYPHKFQCVWLSSLRRVMNTSKGKTKFTNITIMPRFRVQYCAYIMHEVEIPYELHLDTKQDCRATPPGPKHMPWIGGHEGQNGLHYFICSPGGWGIQIPLRRRQEVLPLCRRFLEFYGMSCPSGSCPESVQSGAARTLPRRNGLFYYIYIVCECAFIDGCISHIRKSIFRVTHKTGNHPSHGKPHVTRARSVVLMLVKLLACTVPV